LKESNSSSRRPEARATGPMGGFDQNGGWFFPVAATTRRCKWSWMRTCGMLF
jgi:hypothetical protein